ncbi:unnamed protein product [Pedinophyceae sp. YPF-701]|nr:unnamed protein product [Pedinophyceae sp. YPF-701]
MAYTPASMGSISAEVFTLTYGQLVRQLMTDHQDVDEVNSRLDAIGHSMGVRLADEFLAKSGTERCLTFKDAIDKIAKAALPMFLGVEAQVTAWGADGREVSLVLHENPLTDFVELPRGLEGLQFSQALCGAVRGGLDVVNVRVDCRVVKDALRGDPAYELRVRLLEHQSEEYPFNDDD